jgi:hypothetical protein
MASASLSFAAHLESEVGALKMFGMLGFNLGTGPEFSMSQDCKILYKKWYCKLKLEQLCFRLT